MHETTKIVVLSYIDRLSLIVNMSFMKNRDVKIIESALQVFMRYGIRRTTMNDIAAEAGLVRQTLYTAYSSKNEVLRATIKYFSDKYWAAIEEEWKSSETLGEMLDIYFKHAIVSSFTVINASPGAGDMVDGYNDAGKAEIRKIQANKKRALAGILAPFGNGITEAGLSIDQLADFVQNASIGVRNNAHDARHLKSLLAALKATVLSVTGE